MIYRSLFLGLVTATITVAACQTQTLTGPPTAAGTVLMGDTVDIAGFHIRPEVTVVRATTPLKFVTTVAATNTTAAIAGLGIGDPGCELAVRLYPSADRSGHPVYDSGAPADPGASSCFNEFAVLVKPDSTTVMGNIPSDTTSASSHQVPPGHYYVSVVLENYNVEIPTGDIEVRTP